MKKILLLLICISSSCFGQEGTPDSTFNIGSGFGSMLQNIALQSDNKIIVLLSGNTVLNGQPVKSIFRLNTDGSLDNSFQVGDTFDSFSQEKQILIQDDGKIIIAGYSPGTGDLIRLNSNGSVETTFVNPYSSGIKDLKILADGKILVASSDLAHSVYRFNTDGTLDNTFPAFSATAPIERLAIQSDGKIITGGYGQTRRLNANGTIDQTFAQNFNLGLTGCIAIQADGKILLAGASMGGSPASLVRLNPDGTTDPTLSVVTHSVISSLYLQENGRIIIGGIFTNLNGISCRRLERIFPDGNIDYSFNTAGAGPSDGVTDILHQNDHKLIIGGSFTQYNQIGASKIIRLNAIDPLDAKDFSNIDFSIFPNPTKDIFNIGSSISPDKLEIYDMMGRLVTTSNNLGHQPTGVYIAKIYFNDRSYTKKIVKL